MRICADTHVHTVASGHAHSTLMENAAQCRALGHDYIFLTDHGPAVPDAARPIYFHCLKSVLPKTYLDRPLIPGCEANVLNDQGTLDLPEKTLKRLDWIIVSMHTGSLPPRDCAYHTRAWLAVAENPLVDVIGHPGDERYTFDYEKVIPVFGEKGKLVEINSHSFDIRPGSDKNCRAIARLCARHGVRVVVSSDAHFAPMLGDFTNALAMLEEIGFPEKLVLNADPERLGRYLEERNRRGA